MIKKALDEKYSYQIDEHNIVHLFRGEDDCQQYLTNPLLGAIFKIETLEKENAELKKELVEKGQHLDLTEREWGKDLTKMYHYKTQSTKAKEHIRTLISYLIDWIQEDDKDYCHIADAEQFLKETEE